MIKSNKLDFNKFEIHELSQKFLENSSFDSGDNDLNEFLYEESVDYCKFNLAVVFLVFHEN